MSNTFTADRISAHFSFTLIRFYITTNNEVYNQRFIVQIYERVKYIMRHTLCSSVIVKHNYTSANVSNYVSYNINTFIVLESQRKYKRNDVPFQLSLIEIINKI